MVVVAVVVVVVAVVVVTDAGVVVVEAVVIAVMAVGVLVCVVVGEEVDLVFGSKNLIRAERSLAPAIRLLKCVALAFALLCFFGFLGEALVLGLFVIGSNVYTEFPLFTILHCVFAVLNGLSSFSSAFAFARCDFVE